MFKTKSFWYILLFSLLYLITAGSSFIHAISFFGLANNYWMSLILAFAFELGQAVTLFSLLTSKKDRNRIMPWVLMTMFTLVQVIGNVFSSYKHIITNSVENLKYFKEPIFIWTDLPDQEATVIITWAIGAILPIAALLITSMITNYLSDNENNKEISFNDPIGTEEDSLINQHSILQMENQGLEESNKKKDEEIDNLKKELEKLKNDQEKENPQQGLPESNVEFTGTTEVQRTDRTGEETTTTENKSNNDDGRWSMAPTKDQTGTEDKTPEDSKPKVDEIHLESNEGNPQEIHEEQKIVEESKKPSHFVNL